MTERYRTIVADPPWEQGGTYTNNHGFGKHKVYVESRTTDLPYPTLTVEDIAALPVADLAERDAHLYLWTTQKFLRASFDVCDAWGFSVAATIVWCKQPHGIRIGGAWPATIEFVHFARRGSLATVGMVEKRWYEWPRKRGAPVPLGHKRTQGHSAKPDAFLDLVEQVSPGPYVELFSRRQRLGWSYRWHDGDLISVAAEKTFDAH